jgi:hypothetical protein
MRKRWKIIFYASLIWVESFLSHSVGAFAPRPGRAISMVTTKHQLWNFFGDLGKFLPSDDDGGEGDEEAKVDDEDIGCTQIINLPVESIKPGGLRLFLILYLMGIQNSPEKGSWSLDQPTADEYAVDLYYRDKTAAIMIRFSEHEIQIGRFGSNPSTSFMMQETIVVDGILDELQRLVEEGNIKKEDRLLLLKNENAIANLREELSFG